MTGTLIMLIIWIGTGLVGIAGGYWLGRESAIRDMAWEEEVDRFRSRKRIQLSMIDQEYGIDPTPTGDIPEDLETKHWTREVEKHAEGTNEAPPTDVESETGPYQCMDRENPL